MNSKHTPLTQSGFTLVELMVGLTIGMFVVIVIMQVLSVFEAQKRTTTGSADAQTNGSIALFNIGRELQLSGYPLMPATNSALECDTLSIAGVADTAPASNFVHLSPVTLVEGVAVTGVSASDTVTLRYGDTAMGGIPTQTTAAPINSAATASPAKDVAVVSNFGCQANDAILFTNNAACTLTTAVAAPTNTVTFADSTSAKTNVSAAIASSAGINLACLGNWHEITYRSNTGNLERQDGTGAFVASVAGIVNIQAQYGISAAGSSNQVVQWVNAKNVADWVVASDGTATGVDWGTALTRVNRNRIKAIRIAIVARNAKMETSNVTAACSSTTTASPTGLCAWAGTTASPAPVIDLSVSDTNWRRYRYRVYENIIPLRNVIWAKSTL